MSGVFRMAEETLCVARIFVHPRALMRTGSWWRRAWQSPEYRFVQDALSAGILHASVAWGQLGFAPRAKRVEVDREQVPARRLPLCIELVAPRARLERFLSDHREDLEEAVVLVFEGATLAFGRGGEAR